MTTAIKVSLDDIDVDARSYAEAARDNEGAGRSTLSLDLAPAVKLSSSSAPRHHPRRNSGKRCIACRRSFCNGLCSNRSLVDDTDIRFPTQTRDSPRVEGRTEVQFSFSFLPVSDSHHGTEETSCQIALNKYGDDCLRHCFSPCSLPAFIIRQVTSADHTPK